MTLCHKNLQKLDQVDKQLKFGYASTDTYIPISTV